MGQKVNPISFRIPVRKNWKSYYNCFDSSYRDFLSVDWKLRRIVKDFYRSGEFISGRTKPYLDNVYITCDLLKTPLPDNADFSKFVDFRISIHTPTCNLVIGRDGSRLHELRKKILDMKICNDVQIDVVEVLKPDLSANFVASSLAEQLGRRGQTSVKRLMSKSMAAAKRHLEFVGIKISISGRINGAEIAKTEIVMEGSVPLHSIKANIDYAFKASETQYGLLGIKVWINRSDFF